MLNSSFSITKSMTRQQNQLAFQDELKNLLMEKPTIRILKFIRDNQVHDKSITKGKVIRYMEDNNICSRLTTLKLIQRLLDHEIIVNDKDNTSAYNHLIINPSFDFRKFEIDLLTAYLKEIEKHFQDFNNESKGANTVLIFNLLKLVSDFSKEKIQPYQKDQMKRSKSSTDLRPEPHLSSRGEVI
jgi:hypothetical protein